MLARSRNKGLEIDPESVLTATIATKGYLDSEGIGSCYFLTRPSLIEGFVGHPQSEDDAEAVAAGGQRSAAGCDFGWRGGFDSGA